MRRVYAYKVVRGKLTFKSSEDQEKVLRLMETWRKAINESQRRDWHMGAMPKLLQRTAKEYIERVEAKSLPAVVHKQVFPHRKRPVIHRWMVQLYPQYVRFIDEDFRHVALTTLESRNPVVAEFRCRRWGLLKEALSSPLREGCKRRHVLEVCNPKLTYDVRHNEFQLIYAIRKLIELPTIKEIRDDPPKHFVAIDVNLDDVTYAVYEYPAMKQRHFGRHKWNMGGIEFALKVIDRAKSVHGNKPDIGRRWWRWIAGYKKTSAGEAVSEVLKVAESFNARVIITERLHFKGYKYRSSRKKNRRISQWIRGKILEYLDNNAAWRGISVIYVNPFRNSTRCPRCGKKMLFKDLDDKHWLICNRRCSYEDNRDHIAVKNIASRFEKSIRTWAPLLQRLYMGSAG